MSGERRLRADGQRNRERLMVVAKAAFAEVGQDVSLEEIARRAEVGIGTLYRHFPTRNAIVEAVYRRELQALAEAAPRLLEERAPGEALHEWMRIFIDYIATKKVMSSALSALAASGSDLYATSGATITDAANQLIERAVAAGEVRADMNPGDLMRVLAGFSFQSDSPGWRESALRLVDIFMDGLRPARS